MIGGIRTESERIRVVTGELLRAPAPQPGCALGCAGTAAAGRLARPRRFATPHSEAARGRFHSVSHCAVIRVGPDLFMMPVLSASPTLAREVPVSDVGPGDYNCSSRLRTTRLPTKMEAEQARADRGASTYKIARLY